MQEKLEKEVLGLAGPMEQSLIWLGLLISRQSMS
jgi:hypothetical protein